jgi:hypothetical protein
MKKVIYIIFLLAFLLTIYSCEEDSSLPDERFIGTWISDEYMDTLIFNSDTSFVKPFNDGLYHQFEYSYGEDNITIRYNGYNYVLVHPTTHNYTLKSGQLTIDFSEGCYGFTRNKITYIKQ